MFKTIISDVIYGRIMEAEAQKAEPSRSMLYKLLKQQPVQQLSAEQTMQLKEHPQDVLKNPSSLYILDITPAEALSIQKSYGVISMSGDALSMNLLIDVNDDQTTDRQQILGKGWDTVLNSVETLPNNAVVMNDRYLFKDAKLDHGNGFSNVKDILDELLPKQFLGGDYHVTIIFDRDEVHCSYTFASIAAQLEDIKTQLNRGYPIMIELLGITEQCQGYYELHNRRIVSNYYVVKMEHKIAAFNKNKATVQQSIIPQQLFTESSLKGLSTPPLKSINQMADTLRTFSKSLPRLTDHSIYSYAVNGKVMEKCMGVRNRVIK